ncbi:MAG: DUF2304 domain-containing protein [Patescibacteria group bacterium]
MENIRIYQIIIVFVSAFMIFQGIRNYIKGKSGQTIYKVLIRIVVWGGMAAVTMFPEAIGLLAKTLGIIDNINAVILTGFLLVFLIIFKLLSAIERLERNISILTRKDSLKQLNDDLNGEK